MEQWWIYANRGKLTYSEKNQFNCDFSRYKSHTKCPWFEPKPLWWQAGNYLP